MNTAALRPISASRAVVKTHEVRCGKIELLACGVLRCSPTPVDMDLRGAVELMDKIFETMPDHKPVLAVLDQRSVTRKILPDARKYMQSRTDQIARVAILVSNPISRFFATSMLMVTSMNHKIKIFDAEPAAVAWLLEP